MERDFTRIAEKILVGQNTRGNTDIDISPLLEKLKDIKQLASRYQSGTPAKIDFSHLIAKLRDAEQIGKNLQIKARSGKF